MNHSTKNFMQNTFKAMVQRSIDHETKGFSSCPAAWIYQPRRPEKTPLRETHTPTDDQEKG